MNWMSSDRFELLLQEGRARPVLLQGVFPFMGNGLMNPHSISPDLTYTVPPGRKAVLMYLRAGNASDQLIYISVLGDGKVRRYLPIGPQGASHVELAIKDDIQAGMKIELYLAAGMGVLGTVVIDVGLVEWEGDARDR